MPLRVTQRRPVGPTLIRDLFHGLLTLGKRTSDSTQRPTHSQCLSVHAGAFHQPTNRYDRCVRTTVQLGNEHSRRDGKVSVLLQLTPNAAGGSAAQHSIPTTLA